MAGATMTQPIDEILAPFPGRRCRRIDPGRRLGQIKPVPEDQSGADVEGKDQLVWRGRLAHGFQAVEKGEKIIALPAGDAAEINVWKSRIEMMAVGGDAVMQGAVELIGGPGADAGRPVGGDVGRIDGAELGTEGQSPGKRRAMLARMAASTIAQDRQIASAADGILGMRLA